MDKNITGKLFENVTRGTKDDDGTWKVEVQITEKIRTTESAEWVEESVVAMGMDSTFDEAHKTALRSVLQYLEEEVYAKGFDGLVSAMKEKRKLDASNDNKDTTS